MSGSARGKRSPLAVLAGWRTLAKKVSRNGDIIDVCGSIDIGDAGYDLNRPRLTADLHRYSPFLLAGSEVVRLLADFHTSPR